MLLRSGVGGSKPVGTKSKNLQSSGRQLQLSSVVDRGQLTGKLTEQYYR